MDVVVPEIVGRRDQHFPFLHTEFSLDTNFRWKPSFFLVPLPCQIRVILVPDYTAPRMLSPFNWNSIASYEYGDTAWSVNFSVYTDISLLLIIVSLKFCTSNKRSSDEFSVSHKQQQCYHFEHSLFIAVISNLSSPISQRLRITAFNMVVTSNARYDILCSVINSK